MSPVFRRFFAVVISCAVAIGITYALGELARQVSMPGGADPHNYKYALEHGEFPLASFALILCGWLLAAYTGSRVALAMARSRFVTFAFAVLFTVAVLRDLSMNPHPTWMWIGGALGVPLIALGAAGESLTIRGL